MSVGQFARRRGVTLIEAVLYIAIALALIVGGLVFFQQASRAQKASEAVRLASAMVAEVRAIYQTERLKPIPGLPFLDEGISPLLVARGAVPTQYSLQKTFTYNAYGAYTSSIINPWGGQADLWFTTGYTFGALPRDGLLYLFLQDVPVESCARLAQSNAPADQVNTLKKVDTSIGGSSFGVAITDAETNAIPFPGNSTRSYSPAQAAEACRYGSFAYRNTTGSYSGTAKRLSRVNMMFIFDV